MHEIFQSPGALLFLARHLAYRTMAEILLSVQTARHLTPLKQEG